MYNWKLQRIEKERKTLEHTNDPFKVNVPAFNVKFNLRIFSHERQMQQIKRDFAGVRTNVAKGVQNSEQKRKKLQLLTCHLKWQKEFLSYKIQPKRKYTYLAKTQS